jgi:hypothetical protein
MSRSSITSKKLVVPILLGAIVVAGSLTVAPWARSESGPVAAYSFDEGGGIVAADRAGHGHAVVLRDVGWTKGRHGRALLFDGRSSSASVVHSRDIDRARRVTLEAWIRPDGKSSRTQTIIAKAGNGGVVAYGLRLSSRRLGGVVRVGQKTVRVAGGRRLKAGRWQFVALTYDGKTVRLYRNGSRLAKRRAKGAISRSVRALTFGASAGRRQHFRGAIDNVRVYTRALTARQLAKDRKTNVSEDESSGSGGSSPSGSTGRPTPPPEGPNGFPSSSTTGWQHTGVTLRTVKVGDSGPGWSAETAGGNPVFYVKTNGTVIDGLNIPMCVKVVANDVTIKRSRIGCSSFYTINTSDPPTQFQRLNLTDVELDGLDSKTDQGIAVMATPGATYTRIDVHGFGSSGPRLATDNTLQDSYIHGFVCAPPDHSAGTTANDGGTGIQILRNNVDISTGEAGCASTAIGIDEDFGTYDGVLIRGNLVNGGAYCMYTAQDQHSTNVRVEDNHFGRKYYPRCGQFGPAAQVKSGNGNTFTGNVWDDTGKPVTATTR